MAQAKKAPTVPSVAPQAKPIQKDKVAPLILNGFEAKVDLAFQKNAEMKQAEKIVGQIRNGDDKEVGIDKVATDFRQQQEADGHFTKTVIVKGSAANATYTFKDAYQKIDVSVEGDLQRLLGGEYPNLFERKREISVKKGCYDKLLELAQKHGFTDLLEEDQFLLPVDEFREKRANKRSAFSTEQNKAIDEVVIQVASKPTLNFK